MWHQRCKGDDVRATVAQICLVSGTCWVEYNLPTGQRRSLLRLAELFQLNQTIEVLESDESDEEEDPGNALDVMSEVFQIKPEKIYRQETRWNPIQAPNDSFSKPWREQAMTASELQEWELERREAEQSLEREFLEEHQQLHQEQRERWSRRLDTQQRTLQTAVDEIKSDMDILKEQLYANHQDIEVSFSDYENLFEEREKIDEARGDFEKEQVAKHQELVQRAQDLSKADAEEIIQQETLGLVEDGDIQSKVLALHKDYLEYFSETSRRRIDLSQIEVFQEQEHGITLRLIGGHLLKLQIAPESREKWLDALQPLIKRSKDEAVSTEDPPLPAPLQPPTRSQLASASHLATSMVRGAGATTINAARTAVHAAVDSTSPTASLGAVPFVDVLSTGAMAVHAAADAAAAVSRRLQRGNQRTLESLEKEQIPTSF